MALLCGTRHRSEWAYVSPPRLRERMRRGALQIADAGLLPDKGEEQSDLERVSVVISAELAGIPAPREFISADPEVLLRLTLD